MTRTFYVRIPRLALALLPFTLTAAGAQIECWENSIVAGALPDQPAPVFCSIDGAGPDTSKARPNRFRDTFQHGLDFATFDGTDYTVFDSVGGSVFDSIHWRHSDHWMVDIAPVAPDSEYPAESGGSMISPNGSYRFRNGKLTIETTFAAGHTDYSDLRAWGEMVISTSPAPTGFRPGNSAYAYDMFPGHYTLGCRMQQDGHTICSLMDNVEEGTGLGGRVWEMSFFQLVGETTEGGFPGNHDPEVFRVCEGGVDPDTECRDHFRLELTATKLTMFVNGKKYFEQTGIPPLPTELTEGDIYVYFASMVGPSNYDVIRYHWDGLAVNGKVPLPPEFDPARAENVQGEARTSIKASRKASSPTVSTTPVTDRQLTVVSPSAAERGATSRFDQKYENLNRPD